MKHYDAIVVGGGIAGLTTCAYLSRNGANVLLIEKENEVGGLVKSFKYKDFMFDCGIRAIEVSTGVLSMLKDLSINVEFLENPVTTGIGNNMISVTSKDSINDYQKLLNKTFPDNIKDIETIITHIKQIMIYMDNMYAIDNPLFKDFKNDYDYIFKELFPWMCKFITTQKKCNELQVPVYEYLFKFTKNPKLVDMIGQHFFKDSSAFFALSYFNIHCDYMYPKGGVGTLTQSIKNYILLHGGHINTGSSVSSIAPSVNTIVDEKGKEYSYNTLVWAADTKSFYRIINLERISCIKTKKKIYEKQLELENLKGGDSVLTLYATIDLPPKYFEQKSSAHSFYTPVSDGLLSMDCDERCFLELEGKALLQWCKEYFNKTTYEISIPVLRDSKLAPKGKTGIIVSTLMDFEVVNKIKNVGLYGDFKKFAQSTILKVLDKSIFPKIATSVIDSFVSTPLTIQRVTGNSGGAITGWAHTNDIIPCINKTISISQSSKTPFKNVFQAGQWTFSPAGVPIAIITGKLASDAAVRYLKTQSLKNALTTIPSYEHHPMGKKALFR